ncbi:MAG: hypothetical protein J2P36_22600 [Ktedonobacteraceae bacterium]|nr:hypothetical protein [Ktedonobacteraceae bacterium]
MYSVALCPSATFRAWIASCTPASWTETRRAECIDLVDTPEDERLLSRWWTLDAFLAAKVPKLTLYRSRQEAESVKK